VSSRDLVRIIEAVTERARQSKDPEGLLEAARATLGPAISSRYARNGLLPVITLDATFERTLMDSVRQGDGTTVLAIEPQLAERLVREVQTMAFQAEQTGREPVLICPPRLRPALRRLFAAAAPRLGVLSVSELDSHVKVERIGVVNVAAQAV